VKTRWYGLAGILISVVFIYLAIRGVDFLELFRVLRTTQFGWLSAAVLIYLSAFVVRGLRWRRILLYQKALSLGGVIIPVLVGQMANNILPARTGELYRAHFLGRRARMSWSGAMGSIVVERNLDGLMLVATILLVFFLFPQTQFLGDAAIATSLVFLVLAASIVSYSFATHRTRRVTDKLLELLPRKLRGFIDRRLEDFLQGLRGLSTAGGYLEATAYTVLIWLLEAGAIALVLRSLQVPVLLSGFVIVYDLTALATILPSGPGYIGSYQYAFVLSLGASAIPQETALAVSLTAQIALFGSVTAIGLALLWREHLKD
jgi:glycosyltransferase 2 family protein